MSLLGVCAIGGVRLGGQESTMRAVADLVRGVDVRAEVVPVAWNSPVSASSTASKHDDLLCVGPAGGGPQEAKAVARLKHH